MYAWLLFWSIHGRMANTDTAIRKNKSIPHLHFTMQHSPTCCNTLEHAATHCNTLQHTATHCSTTHRQNKCSWCAIKFSYDMHAITYCVLPITAKRLTSIESPQAQVWRGLLAINSARSPFRPGYHHRVCFDCNVDILVSSTSTFFHHVYHNGYEPFAAYWIHWLDVGFPFLFFQEGNRVCGRECSCVCVFVCVLCLLCVCKSFLCCNFRLLVLAIPTAHHCCLNSGYRMNVLMYTNLMIKLLPSPTEYNCCVEVLPLHRFFALQRQSHVW